jgi:serine/threonine-protein kinase HipA
MIKVWADGGEAGFVDRFGEHGTTFGYGAQTAPERAVSVTMPVRLPSWNTTYGLPPIFEMNLPEGALRERLRLAFAKATGTFDEYDLLAVVGRSQVGRIRYTGEDDALDEQVPFQSVDEILSSRRGGDLFRYLMEKFATASGISGVQPKVLVRDETALHSADGKKPRLSESGLTGSYKGATHVVKFWEPNEFPQLAANEYFCLQAAVRCGLEVPQHRLADDGMALVVDRFDLRGDGTYRGFEDFCVLNARRTDEKYRGSYETSVMKRFQQFANSTEVFADLEKLFTLIALNCAIRNGDAHLKNFGIVYDELLGAARLAPVYDLVTTSVYLANDRMALTLNGTTGWPTAKELQRLGETRMSGSPARVRQILEKIADALQDTRAEVERHIRQHGSFAKIGRRMLEEWDAARAG